MFFIDQCGSNRIGQFFISSQLSQYLVDLTRGAGDQSTGYQISKGDCTLMGDLGNWQKTSSVGEELNGFFSEITSYMRP